MTEEHVNPLEDPEHVGAELTDLLYGELPPGRESRVRTHLEGCPACRAELAELERTRALLGAWSEPGELSEPALVGEPEDLARRAIRSAPRRRRGRLLPLALLAAAAAAAVLLVTGARVSVEPGRLTVSFALPGASEAQRLEDVVRRIAAEEAELRTHDLVARVGQQERAQRLSREELVAFARDIEHLHAQDVERLAQDVDRLLHTLTRESLEEHNRTREALYDLASAVAANR